MLMIAQLLLHAGDLLSAQIDAEWCKIVQPSPDVFHLVVAGLAAIFAALR